MRRIIQGAFILLIWGCSMSGAIRAQQFVQFDDPAFRAKYVTFEFGNHFSAYIQSDDVNNYFLVDFTRLTTRFQKIWFINLTFGEKKIVNIDSDLNKGYVCFVANKRFSSGEIEKLFDDLLEKTTRASAEMTVEKQSEWLRNNDKYK